ncbi:MAG: SPOR domain-containing protein [Alphaproteobacteria bacterium]|nr:SPOR domain-containing protein [Alphaproteobacteria bacterium]
MMADDDDTFELPPRRAPGPPPFASPHPAANEDGIHIPPLRESAEEEENRRASSRSRYGSFFAASAMAAVLMGGAFWWGFEVGKQNAFEQVPPVVRADPSAIKEAPNEPGGLQVPHQDKLVLRDTQGDGEAAAPVTLAPAPEQPAPPPRIVETDAPNTRGVETTQLPPPPVIRDDRPVTVVRPPPALSTPAPAVVPPPPPPPIPSVAETIAVTPAQNAPAPQATVAPQPLTAQPQAAVTGGFRVQLAAYRSPEAAQTGWQALKTRYEDLLGALEPTVVRVDLGERGVFHRLQAGPYTDSGAAGAACIALQARNQGCLVVRP